MPRTKAIEQVWKCGTCGAIQRCPIPAIEAICSAKHAHKKMELIEGEPYKAKEKRNGK